MLIAVTSEGPSLDARIDQRFGRCRYFLIINTDDLGFEAIENQSAALGGGAGIQSAQMIVDRGVARVFTGACGPNAYQVLASAGIEVVTGCAGNVRDVIGQSREGSFTTAAGPNVADHYGMGQNFAAGSGGGMGRGMGMGGGMGRGMGRGMGMGGNWPAGGQNAGPQNIPETADEELETLKREMDRISKRISDLERQKGGKGKG
jgi:predicted Fe-Mo cluster-binding NifX family protein